MEYDIAEKLRQENPEQYLILVRMHLSFIIDLNTDQNESPSDKPKSFKWGFPKKIKNVDNNSKNLNGPTKNSEVFILTKENINQIYQLIDILNEDSNLCQEGIFRRTGSLSRQQQLRKLLSNGEKIDNNNFEKEHAFNVHDMASVLKGILSDMPEPLLLYQHYHAYCHLANKCFSDNHLIDNTETKLMGALRLLLLLLPPLSRQLAKRLLFLLHRTVSHEASNRMSSSALATMFSPHVMCLRRQSPESLHNDSQILAPILSFMITNTLDLFTIPTQLETDIKAYFTKQEQKRLLSPQNEDLNESVTERTAANTVFTFVDRQMSRTVDQPEGQSRLTTTFTDTALAQLYAHIQALPESQNKKKLIKQFNRENGHGTPLQLQRAQKQKSITQSLKKHIFNKNLMNKTLKKTSLLNEQGFGYQSIIESPTSKMFEKNQSQTSFNILELNDFDKNVDSKINKNQNQIEEIQENSDELLQIKNSSCSLTPQLLKKKLEADILLTSTPRVSNLLIKDVENYSTPISSLEIHTNRKGSMSPITKSTQKMPRAMQESIMTPRSRKPVIINCDVMTSNQTNMREQVNTEDETPDLSDSYSTSSSSIKNDSDFVSTDESCPSKSYCIKYKRFKDNNLTKDGIHPLKITFSECSNLEISEIKHIISDDVLQLDSSKYKISDLNQSDNKVSNDRILQTSNSNLYIKSKPKDSLTEPFRNYLLCRSILTKSPIDLSFCNESDINITNLESDKMTDSLMYCLDGNTPNLSNSLIETSDKELLLKNQSICNESSDITNLCDKSQNMYKHDVLCVNKENINPGQKRSAQQNDKIDIEKIENKKILLAHNSICNKKIDASIELIESNSSWYYEEHGELRETNL